MKPVRGLAARKDAKLAEKLASYKDSLSPEELQKIEAATNELSAYQETPDRQEDIEKIPILNRSDITRDVKRFSNIKYHAGNVKILCHDYETNGIGYLRLVFDISHIQENLWPFVGVLQSVLGVIDTENYGYGDLFNEINLETGGVGTLIETYGRYGEGHDKEELSFYSKATTDVEFLFPFGWGELWGIADRTNYDLTRHQEVSGEDMERKSV